MENLQNEIYFDAPEVTLWDTWGDAACLDASAWTPAVVLPPKREKTHKPGDIFTAPDGGLRIGPRLHDPAVHDEPARLEVQKIDGKVVRLQPEEPTAPRMPRQMVFHELECSQDELALAGEAQEWGKAKKQPLLWMFGTGAAVAAMVVGGMLLLPLINKSSAAKTQQETSEWVLETMPEGRSMSDMLSRKAEAVEIFQKYKQATSVEQLLPLVREPEALADLIRANHHPVRSGGAMRPPHINSWIAREQQSLTYGLLKGIMADYSAFEAYFVLSQGRLVMDWKASTAYGTADFDELAENRGNPAEIRGWIEPADFYTLVFPEASYRSYQLLSPDRERVIWVYARRGGDAYEQLRTLFKGGYILEGRKDAGKVTVRLGPGPAGALPGQWSILELLHKEWIAP